MNRQTDRITTPKTCLRGKNHYCSVYTAVVTCEIKLFQNDSRCKVFELIHINGKIYNAASNLAFT